MTLRRAILVLSIVGAMLGAPRPASAAGNVLIAAPPTPATGSPQTMVTLTVTYDGRFPAQLVTATIAGRTLPMVLVGGSASTGTWRVATTLPPGTWTASFAAVAVQGNEATAMSAPISISPAGATPVAGPATSVRTPAPPTTGVAPAPENAAPDDGTPPTDAAAPNAPVPAPEATQRAVARPAAPTPAAAVNGPPVTPARATPAPTTAPDARPAPVASAHADASAAALMGAPTPSPATKRNEAPTGSGVPGSGRPSWEPSAGLIDKSLDDPAAWARDYSLGLTLVGIAAAGMLGTASIVAARRRGRTDDPVREAAAGSAPGSAQTPGGPLNAAAVRRQLRRRDTEDEDPILAAMGIGSGRARTRAGAKRERRDRDEDGEPPRRG